MSHLIHRSNWDITKTGDNWITPFEIWQYLEKFIPKNPNELIWEPFYYDGKSGIILNELGYKVYHTNEDFFEKINDVEFINCISMVISNPPFSKKAIILSALITREIPFVLILPIAVLKTKYLRVLVKDLNPHEFQIVIIPSNVMKFIDPKTNEKTKSNPIDCAFFCYKVFLNKDILFI